MDENEIEALGHVKRVLLLIQIIFGFSKDALGFYAAKKTMISILNKITFEDVEAWQRKAAQHSVQATGLWNCPKGDARAIKPIYTICPECGTPRA